MKRDLAEFTSTMQEDGSKVAATVKDKLTVRSILHCSIVLFLVHGQVTIIFVVSVCLFVCLCVEFFSAVFDPISIKLGHMLYVWV